MCLLDNRVHQGVAFSGSGHSLACSDKSSKEFCTVLSEIHSGMILISEKVDDGFCFISRVVARHSLSLNKIPSSPSLVKKLELLPLAINSLGLSSDLFSKTTLKIQTQ